VTPTNSIKETAVVLRHWLTDPVSLPWNVKCCKCDHSHESSSHPSFPVSRYRRVLYVSHFVRKRLQHSKCGIPIKPV